MGAYKASYSISCGETREGKKIEVSLKKDYLFEAQDNEEALRMAVDEAKSFAYDYKASPKTGLTMILLDSLEGKEGRIPHKTEGSVIILNRWDHFAYYWLGYVKK